MNHGLYIVTAALSAALGAGCGVDRPPWSGADASDTADLQSDQREDEQTGAPDLRGDAVPDPADARDAAVDAAYPDLADLADLPDVSEVADAYWSGDPADLQEIEACAPDCDGKECGPDGCGGSCGVCPGNKPLCNMAFQCEACEADCNEKNCGPDGCGGSCGTCPAGWACAAGTCEAPVCQGDQTLHEESFEACNEGAMVVVDDQPDDPVTWLALEEGAFSPPCALHLGDPVSGSYDTGDPVSIALHLPAVTVPDDGDPYLARFMVRMDAEGVVAPEYPYDHDVLHLRAYGEGLPDGGVPLFDSKEFLNNTEGAWVPVAVSLAPYAGLEIQLRFEFDTIDSTANDYGGVWLDDLRVGTACPLCFEDGDCVDDEPCLADLCVLFSNQEELGSCAHLPKETCCAGMEPGFCDDGDPCTEDACDPVTGDCTHLTIEGCGW